MGAWDTSSIKDPIDDTTFTLAMLYATSGQGTYDDPVSLAIGCYKGSTSFAIDWKSLLGMDDLDVTYRIDDAPAETQRWTISTVDYDTTFFPAVYRQDAPVLAFIQKLMEADQLLARVQPYSGASITATFDLTGMDVAVEEVRVACGW